MTFKEQIDQVIYKKRQEIKSREEQEQQLQNELKDIENSIYRCLHELHEGGYSTNIKDFRNTYIDGRWTVTIDEFFTVLDKENIAAWLRGNPGTKAEDLVKDRILKGLTLEGDEEIF